MKKRVGETILKRWACWIKGWVPYKEGCDPLTSYASTKTFIFAELGHYFWGLNSILKCHFLFIKLINSALLQGVLVAGNPEKVLFHIVDGKTRFIQVLYLTSISKHCK